MGAAKSCLLVVKGNNEQLGYDKTSQLHYNVPVKAESFTDFENVSKEFDLLINTQEQNTHVQVDRSGGREQIKAVNDDLFQKHLNLNYTHSKIISDSQKIHENSPTLEIHNRGSTSIVNSTNVKVENLVQLVSLKISEGNKSGLGEEEIITHMINELLKLKHVNRIKHHSLTVPEQQFIQTTSLSSKNATEKLSSSESSGSLIRAQLAIQQLWSIQESEEDYMDSIQTPGSSRSRNTQFNKQKRAQSFDINVHDQRVEGCLSKYRRGSTKNLKQQKSKHATQIIHSLF